jgi:heme/copper-type cytochrome/quinol oxidase subunit 3
MKGAIVFLAVFALLVVLTLGNTSIPPGQAIYNAFLPGTEAASGYLIAGSSVDAVTAIIAVFNGVIYGFIAWLIFTLLMMFTGKDKKPQNIQQIVNVNVGEKKDESPPPPQ